MPPARIDNPILNSPFLEPERHFEFGEEGITGTILPGRRKSAYWIPVPRPKSKGKQTALELYDTEDRYEENFTINRIRDRVRIWRMADYQKVTTVTRALLDHWNDPDRERPLFFCQREAAETAIYLQECARHFGDDWIAPTLRLAHEEGNSPLYRIAFKMATGSGKTILMAMLIAWQTLNSIREPGTRRYSRAFLVVTPGITIRDRLRVLLPSDPQSAYQALDLVPQDLRADLQQARIHITNFHAFQPRETVEASKLTKKRLAPDDPDRFKEDTAQMVRRVCRDLGRSRDLVVLNDEAHHCFRRRPDAEAPKLTGEERQEAEERDKEARIWINGLEAVRKVMGVRAVYDLSATPFFLKGSGYTKVLKDGKKVGEGILFPWVVSDFSLVDAIEAGVVKVPRVPVEDTTMATGGPIYRDLYPHIRDELPRKGRARDAVGGEPHLPAHLEGALTALYGSYERSFRAWQAAAAGSETATPPVFIVVCNNTNVSKLVFDYAAGWEKPLADGGRVLVPGALSLFSNVEDSALGARWRDRPNTILIDSQELESGEGMSPEFKRIAGTEIEEFKREMRRRFPDRNVDDLTDEDLLREVMNTVGKPGRLGEQVRCVVSVSMLTEGWDANTVTHILGVRAFGTQLLCEQVVGRGLRRVSFTTEPRTVVVQGREQTFEAFTPEYAEVFGVPFSFIPGASGASPPERKPTTRVRALPERSHLEMTFPRLEGYYHIPPVERLDAAFTPELGFVLGADDVATWTRNEAIAGEGADLTLESLRCQREQTIAFDLARRTLERYFNGEENGQREERPWLFPDLLEISRRWLRECLVCKDTAFPQLLKIAALREDAVDKIFQGIVRTWEGELRLLPRLRRYDAVGSTRYVDFETARPVYPTDPEKSHVSHVVCDTDSWEQKMAQSLEAMDEVVCYVKNFNLGFTIPYSFGGVPRQYVPDYLVRLHDEARQLNLILEVSGEGRKDKAAKVATARNLWVPAVNNDGSHGFWAFLEIGDPWDAINTIRGTLGGLFAESTVSR